MIHTPKVDLGQWLCCVRRMLIAYSATAQARYLLTYSMYARPSRLDAPHISSRVQSRGSFSNESIQVTMTRSREQTSSGGMTYSWKPAIRSGR